MERKVNISYGLEGMNRTGFGHQLNEKDYTFQLNGNIETDEQGGVALTNEHSNLLCSRFKPGFRVIGNIFDVNSDRVYFFLTNPETKISEIGYIPYFHNIENDDDLLKDCNCTYENILSQPLEEQEQIAGCQYVTLLSDGCLKSDGEINGCLNFNIKHPIKKIELKGEKYFRTLYWTDNYNPPRYLQLQNLEQYNFNGEDVCGEIICGDGIDVENPQKIEDCQTCLDCEKLRIFKRFTIPHIEPSVIQFGGNLRMGTYEFLIAYADRLGNELSEYFSITQPISIFDSNNYILNQTQLANRTNLSIALNVSNLDKNYQYYKVAVIQRTDINGETSAFVEGIHPITDDTVVYSTEVDKQRITFQELFAQKPVFKTWRGLTSANNYLFGYGYTVEKEWNLQPVVNFMGSFFKWQSHQAKEGIYSDGINTSKYRGYMRDESYPLSIRFGTKDGYWTSNFPLISRPANEDEKEQIVFESNGRLITSDKNAESILEFTPNCALTDRIYKWQYYNTATQDGYCVSYDLEDFDTIVRTTTEICKVKVCYDAEGNAHGCSDSETCVTECSDVIDTIESATIRLPIDSSDFRGLKNWFKENKDLVRYCCIGLTECYPNIPQGNCPNSNTCNPDGGYPDVICQLATNTYPEYTCEPNLPFDICTDCTDSSSLNANECLPPVFVTCSEDIYIKQVVDETYYLEEKIWNNGEEPETEYERTQPRGTCQMYIEGQGEGFRNGRLLDQGLSGEAFTLFVSVYKRLSDMLYNNNCQSSSDLYEIQYSSVPSFMDYMFDLDNIPENLLTDYNSIPATANMNPNAGTHTNLGFSDKVSKQSLWYKIKKEELQFVNQGEEPSIIFEITYQSIPYYSEDSKKGYFEYHVSNKTLRYTIYKDCSGSEVIESGTFEDEEGFWKMFKESDFDSNNTDTFYIVLDSPLITSTGDDGTFNAIAPTSGCFNVVKRPKEYKCAEITFTEIQVSKKETYEAECKYIVPFLNDCEPSPFQYGKFAYWESQEEYPNNTDLYNSSKLVIAPEDIPSNIQDEFEEYFIDGYTNLDNYHLSADSDFRCKPIRHFKFPDNIISPFIFDQPTGEANDTIIYPLGITFDDDMVNAFLDIAVKNNLINQEQRDSITNYEVYRGDRTIHKSVLYKGIANDMYRYYDKGKEWWFRNFPYNSLGENQLIYENNFRGSLIQHPFDSESNNKFSILAPEVYYNQPSSATEVAIEGYQLGYSQGAFKEVEGHSKWVILGDDAKDLASTLATLEVAFESAMNIGDAAIGMATSMWSGWTAFSWGFGFAIAGHVAITIANIASAVLFKYARYKYEWLNIFKNNGTPYNFANYYISEGKYNFFYPNNLLQDENYLRGLAVGKYIRPGNAIINDEKGRSVVNVNNIERETSFFVSFGQEYNIEYPPFYTNWDNVDASPSSASRFLSTDSSCDNMWATNKRIASPYMSVKVYNPSQYGSIDSIKWLPINYNGILKKEANQNECKSIFGGDVFITRTAFKTKYPLFLTNATKLPDRTPIDYFLYPNIGSPRYFASYETPITQIEQGRAIPTADTVYNFNCPDEDTDRSGDFYVKPTNGRNYKFFLFYYGIPYFFTESTINSDYRYAGLEPHEQFYPNVDIVEWTQENKTTIQYNNTFLYNNTYSKDVTPNGARTLPAFYNTAEWNELYNYPNGVVWSEQDNSEQDLRDPWLIYRPLNKYQFSYEYGMLIDLEGVESFQVLGRFENNALIFNAIDTIADRLTENNYTLGTGGIFATRPTEFSHTELGETGSQHTDLITTEFGHFWTDAKRGKVFQLDPNAKGLTEISSFKRDGSPSGMRQWFKRHLPFKILRNKKIDNLTEQSNALDNKYNSLGINMWWDSKFKRLFITKRDYIIDDPCVKYSDELGFYIDETECNGLEPIISCPDGYTYNEQTEMCELTYTTPPCPSLDWEYNPDTNTCTQTETTPPQTEEEIITTITCPEGYTYNETTQICELTTISPPQCPEGYTYNIETQQCENITVTPLECPDGYTYIPEDNLCRGSLEDCEMDLIFVIDQSASMNDAEYNQMKNFAVNLTESLQSRIENGFVRIGVIRFSSTVQGSIILQNNYSNIINYLNAPRVIAGQTNLVDAICRVNQDFITHGRPGVNKKVIILSDGTQFVTMNPLSCNTYSNDDDGVLNVTGVLKSTHNPQIGLIITGDTTERNIVKNAYVNGSSSNPNFPLPTSGNGISGLYAYEAEFTDLNNIINDVLDELISCDTIVEVPLECPDGCTQVGSDCQCVSILPPQCPDDNCQIISNQCSCYYQTTPTITQETIINYSCPEGWTFNQETLTCEKIITQQGCSDQCNQVDNQCQCSEQIEPIIDTIKTPVELKDFKDVSWTVSYSPIYDSWISYHSFTPDYSISYNDFFQTGLNNPKDELEQGLWSHLLTNRSYQVYYGKKYPWIIEVPFKNEYVSKILESVTISSLSYRYHNEYDFAERRKESFNKVNIYNGTNNSGNLNLQYSDIADDYKYPVQVDPITQTIKATHHKGTVRFNYIFNRVIDQDNNIPIWNWDDNEITKTLNPQAISFRSKQILEKLRGDMYYLRLAQDKSSQYKQLFKFSLGIENIDKF